MQVRGVTEQKDDLKPPSHVRMRSLSTNHRRLLHSPFSVFPALLAASCRVPGSGFRELARLRDHVLDLVHEPGPVPLAQEARDEAARGRGG